MVKALKIGLVILIFGVSIILAVYFSYLTFQKPYIGIDVSEGQLGYLAIDRVYHHGWAKENGLHERMIIQYADYHPAVKHWSYETFQTLEQVRDLRTFDMSNGVKGWYPITQQTPAQFLYHLLFPVFFFLICITVSIVLLRRSSDVSTYLLSAFLLAVALTYLSIPVSLRKFTIGQDMIWIFLSIIPSLFLHFIYAYLPWKRDRALLRFLLVAMYSGSATLIAFYTVANETWLVIRSVPYETMLIIFYSINICLYLFFLTFRQRHSITSNRLQGLKIIILSVTFVFVSVLVFIVLPHALTQQMLVELSYIGYILLLIPSTLIYQVSSKNLFDIDVYLNRIPYYLLTALIPTIITIVAIMFVLQFDGNWQHWLQIILIIYSIFIGFSYLKERVDIFSRSYLLPEKYHFQSSIDRLAEALPTFMKTRELESYIIHEVQHVLKLDQALILQVDKQSKKPIIKLKAAHIKNDDNNDLKSLSHSFNSQDKSIVLGKVYKHNHYLWIIIGESNNYWNVLWMKKRKLTFWFNEEARNWLKSLGQYVCIVYENLQSVETIIQQLEQKLQERETIPPWVLRLLFQISEKERKNLAIDLHDAALQEQLYWYRRFDQCVSNQSIPVELHSELNEIKEGLLDVIYQIRETCNELRPPFLKEMGFIQALHHLFEKSQLRTNYSIHFDADGFNAELSDEQSIMVYRIVQEWLTNAEKHSHATKLQLRFWNDDRTIYITYRDNGIGFASEKRIDPLTNTHIGLFGIKERVRSLDGDIHISSEAATGLSYDIRLPLNPTHT